MISQKQGKKNKNGIVKLTVTLFLFLYTVVDCEWLYISELALVTHKPRAATCYSVGTTRLAGM